MADKTCEIAVSAHWKMVERAKSDPLECVHHCSYKIGDIIEKSVSAEQIRNERRAAEFTEIVVHCGAIMHAHIDHNCNEMLDLDSICVSPPRFVAGIECILIRSLNPLHSFMMVSSINRLKQSISRSKRPRVLIWRVRLNSFVVTRVDSVPFSNQFSHLSPLQFVSVETPLHSWFLVITDTACNSSSLSELLEFSSTSIPPSSLSSESPNS